MTSSYPAFRRKLDAVLRQRDPQALRAFLIAEGQWEESTATDPERAMWMMIATSPALAALHDEATGWLANHGFVEEARALGGKHGGPNESRRPTRQPPPGPKHGQPARGRPPRRPPDRGGADDSRHP